MNNLSININKINGEINNSNICIIDQNINKIANNLDIKTINTNKCNNLDTDVDKKTNGK